MMFESSEARDGQRLAGLVGDGPSRSAFVRGLERYGALSDRDIAVIESALPEYVRHFDVGCDLVRSGDTPVHAFIILEGWGYRYKILANHRRQIIAFLLPGDLTDLNVFLLGQMDHSIAGLTPLTVAALPKEAFDLFFSGDYPAIAKVLWIKALADAAVQREWTVNLGQRSAPERIGHVLCEIFHRLERIGLTVGNRCALPLTQGDLAETTGLSLVHVNKRLRDLRHAGLIDLRGKTLTIPDLGALERASLFSAHYLNVHAFPSTDETSGQESGRQAPSQRAKA